MYMSMCEYVYVSMYMSMCMYMLVCIWVCIWVCVCICEYVYVSMYVSMYVWVCIYEYVYVYVWVCMCEYVYVSMYMYVWVCICEYVWVCMCEYVYVSMYMYVYVSMYMWVCICEYVCVSMYMWVCIWVCVSMYLQVPYCPGQVPLGTRSSSTKNWGWAVTRRRSLNGLTIPTQGPTADAKLAARGHLINMFMFANNALLGGGVKVRVWIREQRKIKRRSKANLNITDVGWLQILCCRKRMLQTRPWTGVCELLIPEVEAPKAHQNNSSYVSSADQPSDLLCKIFAWWAVIRRTSKNPQNCQNWGEGACPGQYMVCVSMCSNRYVYCY